MHTLARHSLARQADGEFCAVLGYVAELTCASQLHQQEHISQAQGCCMPVCKIRGIIISFQDCNEASKKNLLCVKVLVNCKVVTKAASYLHLGGIYTEKEIEKTTQRPHTL